MVYFWSNEKGSGSGGREYGYVGVDEDCVSDGKVVGRDGRWTSGGERGKARGWGCVARVGSCLGGGLCRGGEHAWW